MLSELLEKLAQGLDARDVPYMVIGGQAVLVYGEPRMTRDIDVTLGIGPEGLAKVEDLMLTLGLTTLPESPAEFVHQRMVLPCKDEESGFRIDFIFSFTPYERQAIERARSVQVGNTKVRFASPEDLIIHKMVAGRPRDEEDVRGILLKTSVDVPYIENWLRQFDQALGRGTLERFQNLRQSIHKRW
ncbi:MAG TPA: nucleotidyl transferase AbiEii/AbiGii toxin family protein [Terriglobia bacterium]|nr:nucleotidyl transferase AbiEii/AbiGii toxin family protein [Terriglobia bacterium]